MSHEDDDHRLAVAASAGLKSLDSDIAAGRAAVDEIRREAGFDPESDEPTDHEALWRYIELLEARVVGQVSAQRFISRTLRP